MPKQAKTNAKQNDMYKTLLLLSVVFSVIGIAIIALINATTSTAVNFEPNNQELKRIDQQAAGGEYIEFGSSQNFGK